MLASFEQAFTVELMTVIDDYTRAFSFENAYISMRFGLPSTLTGVDTRKRILLKTITSLVSIATLSQILSQLVA